MKKLILCASFVTLLSGGAEAGQFAFFNKTQDKWYCTINMLGKRGAAVQPKENLAEFSLVSNLVTAECKNLTDRNQEDLKCHDTSGSEKIFIKDTDNVILDIKQDTTAGSYSCTAQK